MDKELEEFHCQLSRHSRKSSVKARNESFCRGELAMDFMHVEAGNVCSIFKSND